MADGQGAARQQGIEVDGAQDWWAGNRTGRPQEERALLARIATCASQLDHGSAIVFMILGMARRPARQCGMDAAPSPRPSDLRNRDEVWCECGDHRGGPVNVGGFYVRLTGQLQAGKGYPIVAAAVTTEIANILGLSSSLDTACSGHV